MMIGRQAGFRHFVVPFGKNGDFSRRLMTPKKDEVPFKMTAFHGEKGSDFPDLVDHCYETVFVLSGRIAVYPKGNVEGMQFGAGGFYCIKPDENRRIEI